MATVKRGEGLTGRTPHECFQKFADILNPLFTGTLSRISHLAIRPDGHGNASLSTEAAPITIDTSKYGKLYLRILQRLSTGPTSKRGIVRLQTNLYSYRLSSAPGLRDTEPLFRWEYEREAELADRPPRHHLHVPGTLPTNGDDLELKMLHIPTGWVAIEEVIRFMIADLGHTPPERNDGEPEWWEIVRESEKRFRGELVSKPY
ncbi:MAG: hypothetical protein AAF605_08335 [Myxococcota bacterium]